MLIHFNEEWHDNAVEEQRERAPYMVTKFNDSPARKAGQIRGLVIEYHVSGWFKNNYPSHYLEPDNYRKWTEKCSHDFKLRKGFKTHLIDVSGPRKDGSFGSYPSKPKGGVDFHILCKPIGFKAWNDCDFRQGFKILGVVDAIDYLSTIDRTKVVDFGIWLNKIGLC